jgi:hypothetical protein
MQCGDHDNFILKALPEMSKGIGVKHEGGYGEKECRGRVGLLR